MRYFFTILAALLLCSAPLQAQTLKALMYNTTNGQVVANTGTNALTFTQLNLSNGTFVDQAQFAAPQFSDASLSFEESRLRQYGINIIQWETNASVTFGNSSGTREALGFSASLSALWEAETASNARSAVGLPLAALTNTSNVTMMRALAGSTNANPSTTSITFEDAVGQTHEIFISNGIIMNWGVN